MTNWASIAALGYLTIGLFITAISFGALWLVRKMGEPSYEEEEIVRQHGKVLLALTLILFWPYVVARRF